MSIEAFVIINFLMNLLVLFVGARAAGHVRWKRVLISAAAGTAYALIVYVWAPALRGLTGQTFGLLIAAVILFAERRRRRKWFKGMIHIAGSCVFAGGMMTLLTGWFPAGSLMLAAAGCLCVLTCAFISDLVRPEGRGGQTVLLKICTRMGSVEVEALVDTGNRLREPLSGLPVLIVGRRWLRGLLDETSLQEPDSRLQPGFRMVRYGALGGSGMMRCFRPESVCFCRRGCWMEAPDLWVAIYPGEIPSGVEALAPPLE